MILYRKYKEGGTLPGGTKQSDVLILYRKYQNSGEVSILDRAKAYFGFGENTKQDKVKVDVKSPSVNPDVQSVMDVITSKTSGSDADLKLLMNMIPYHESKRLLPTDKDGKRFYEYYIQDRIQDLNNGGEGKGSGYYQFETGENAGGISAMNRTVRFFKAQGWDIPAWLKDSIGKTSYAVGTLKPEQQDIVFLANAHLGPVGKAGSSLSSYLAGKETAVNFWLNSHRRSPKGDALENMKADSLNMVNTVNYRYR